MSESSRLWHLQSKRRGGNGRVLSVSDGEAEVLKSGKQNWAMRDEKQRGMRHRKSEWEGGNVRSRHGCGQCKESLQELHMHTPTRAPAALPQWGPLCNLAHPFFEAGFVDGHKTPHHLFQTMCERCHYGNTHTDVQTSPHWRRGVWFKTVFLLGVRGSSA